MTMLFTCVKTNIQAFADSIFWPKKRRCGNRRLDHCFAIPPPSKRSKDPILTSVIFWLLNVNSNNLLEETSNATATSIASPLSFLFPIRCITSVLNPTRSLWDHFFSSGKAKRIEYQFSSFESELCLTQA